MPEHGGTRLGRVAELWRYPVKSLGGERLETVECLHRGLAGDRAWAVRGADGKIGSGKTTRRFRRMPGLLSMSAFTGRDGTVWVRFPTGSRARAGDADADRRAGAILGEPVTLERETAVPHFDSAALHVLTFGSLEWVLRGSADGAGVRRFRPNVLVGDPGGGTGAAAGTAGDLTPEDGWSGSVLRIGLAEVQVLEPTERCVMVTLAQPGLGFAPKVLKELEAARSGCLGVYAGVLSEGTVSVGDDVVLSDRPSSSPPPPSGGAPGSGRGR